MKKAQSSLFVIIGLAVLILVSIIFVTISNRKQVNLETKNYDALTEVRMRNDISENINFCVENSVRTTMEDTGIRQETVNEYETLATTRIDDCVNPLFKELERQKYDVQEGVLLVDIGLNPEAIVVDVDYPIKIEKGERLIQFDEFQYTFDRANVVKIPGGITDKETRIVAPDDRAEILIPPGVEIRDNDGNLVDEVGLKVEDLHFDGLENKHLVGQLVYEGYPDVTFSEPVEISLDFREEDIPEGYTEEDLGVSYWDEDDGIWYAFPTEIHNGVASSNITHLSSWAIVSKKRYVFVTEEFNVRFKPTGGSPDDGTRIWLIGGRVGDPKGTVSFQTGWDFSKLLEHNNYMDWREELELNKSRYLSFPKTEYGYYTLPDNPYNDGVEFVDCEKPGEHYGVKHGMKQIDGMGDLEYPYYEVCDPDVNEAAICEACGEYEYSSNFLECNPICEGTTMGQSPGQQGKICVPISLTSKKCKLADECVEREGWHNLQCSGGRVLPGDEDAASFIVFEPNGNAVLDYLYVRPYPSESQTEDWTNFFLQVGGLREFSFYCRIQPFQGQDTEESSYVGVSEIDLSSELKKEIGYSGNFQVLGVQGLDIIKKTEHEKSRRDTNAKCELYWIMGGNGIVTFSNPTSRYLPAGPIGDKIINKVTNFAEDKWNSIKNKFQRN